MNSNPGSLCFHCAEPIGPGIEIRAQLKGRQAAVCCEGCRAVAELIATVGLEDYYRYRSEPGVRPIAAHDNLDSYDQIELQQQYSQIDNEGRRSTTLLLEGLRCAACAWLIDRTLQRIPGICEISVNTATSRARIVWLDTRCSFSAILHSIAALGYRPLPVSAEAIQQCSQRERRAALKRLAVSGLGMMQVMMFAVSLYLGQAEMDGQLRQYLRIASLLVTTPVMFYAGWPFLRGAARSLRLRSVGMDMPVALALLMAYGASVWNTVTQRGEVYFDSITMFIFFLTLGRYIEMLVRHRTGAVTEALTRLLPRIAHRFIGTVVEDVAVHRLVLGDAVLVRVGETIPADGQILSGVTRCEEALLTGESMPVKRTVGDQVIAGTLNMEAPFHMRVTAVGQATVLHGIVALLDRAQAHKPRLARVADDAATWFLRRVLVGTALVGLAWLWIDPSRAFDAVLAVLVVTCPCALSLATPAAIAAATTALARHGLLVTNGDAIEALSRIDHVLFDKTGTLTHGHIAVEACELRSTLDAKRCLAIAAALEQAAEHPIAVAFRNEASTACMAQQVRVVSGQGVEGSIDGRRYRIGTPEFVQALLAPTAGNQPTNGAKIWLGNEQQVLAEFTLSDPLRQEAATVVRELDTLGITSYILSGDAPESVANIARQTGIQHFVARLSPADKLTQLLALTAKGAQVAVLGDGINDAPMLRAAPVSIAMGNGSALAQVSADVVLMSASLKALPTAISIARRTQIIMRQNLTWAAIYNLCALPLAAMGVIAPWLAAIGMSISSVVVVLNALRLLPRRLKLDTRPAALTTPTAVVIS